MKKILFIVCVVLLTSALSAGAWTVVEGETLCGIGNMFGYECPSMIDANPQLKNPNLIYPDQEVNIPAFMGDPTLGVVIPDVVAVYEDTLQAKITSAATSFTLVRGTDAESNNLSGTYGFVLNEGGADQEFVIATCVATACTSVQRGIDVTTGISEITALKKAHRRGASVKQSNWPILGILRTIMNGAAGFPETLYYDTLTDCNSTAASSTAIMCKSYYDNLAAQGAATSTPTLGGIVREGTQTEIASSTDNGADDPTYVHTQYVTSTPSALRGLYIPMAENDGYLSHSWLDFSETFTFTGNNTYSGNQTYSGSSTHSATSTFDGNVVGAINSFGDGFDSASTTPGGGVGDMSLDRDYYFTNYTVSSTDTIITNGFKIFASGTLTVNGTISFNGNDGDDGTDGTGEGGGGGAAGVGGAGGTALNIGSVFGSYVGITGNGGTACRAGNSDAGVAGQNVDNLLGGDGVAGVQGGNGGSSSCSSNVAGAGGAAGSGSTASSTIRVWTIAQNLFDWNGRLTAYSSSGGGSGGAGGCIAAGGSQDDCGGGGGAGGAGSNAGMMSISAKNIVISATGSITLNGGIGGDGGNGGADTGGQGGGGGAGGSGGSGGYLTLIYDTIINNGTLSVSGGVGGSGGNGGSSGGIAGNTGNTGNTGSVRLLEL